MTTQHTNIRWLLLVGLAGFVPLPYFLAVVGGLLPYGGILLIMVNNVFDGSLLLWSLAHLTIYGVALYWMAQIIALLLMRFFQGHVWFATAVVLLLLSCIGLIPMFGVAHGQIHWTSAYELYTSGKLR